MMEDVIDKIRRLYDDEKYEEAVRLAEDAEQSGTVNPALLVWKFRSLLLSDASLPFELGDAERWLQQALAIDRDYLPALLDLGFFYLRMMDDVKRAWPLFERAREVCTEDATETLTGLSECIAEMDSPQAALKFLNEQNLLIDELKLKELKSDIQAVIPS